MTTAKTKKPFKMPHVFIIMMIIMILVVIISYIIPSGSFERTLDPESGLTVVDPDSFQFIPNDTPIGVMDYFTSIYNGVVTGGTIMASLLICSGVLGFLESTGSFAAGIHKLMDNAKGKEFGAVVVFYIVFTIFGVLGFGEGAYPFYGLAVSVIMALGFDRLTGAVTVISAGTAGFACGMLNMFTTGVSQQLVGLPMFSGIEFRFVALVVFFLIGLGGLTWYCKRIKKDPEKSFVKEEYLASQGDGGGSVESQVGERVELTGKRIFGLASFVGVVIIQGYGCINMGWGLADVSALYVMFAILIAVVFRVDPSTVCTRIVTSASRVLGPALAIGLARSIMLLLNQAKILDTLVYYMGNALHGKSPLITLLLIYLFVTFFNFFVVSGSGKAVMMMPILNPLSEMLGINKQVMVLTYQFGDGLTNSFWPSGGVVSCSLCGLDYGAWMKYAIRVYPFFFLAAYILIVVADYINLGPF